MTKSTMASVPTEAAEQAWFVDYLKLRGYKFTHIPNETGHSPEAFRRAIRMKRQVVGNMTALDTLFRKFISGGTHLLPVERDDKIVGIVTIEDLLEEIVGHEIEDETDRAKHR